MISNAIPKRYARALMAAAREEKRDIEKLAEELRLFAELVKPGTPLRSFLRNPFFPALRKSQILDQIIGQKGLSPLCSNFLRLLLGRGRLLFLPDISHEFRRLADDAEGIIRGEAVTATELPQAVLDSLREALAKRMSKKVILTIRRDPALIGGIVVRIGSLSLDGSIRAHLNRMKEKLIEEVTA